jgi:signal transduction histidine kinase
VLEVVDLTIENAVYAAGKGGWIDITSEVGGDNVSIVVTDSGRGRSNGHAFQNLRGLGHPVSRVVALPHGGTLDVQDRGTGSAFVVSLPLAGTVGAVSHQASNSLAARHR